KWSFDLRAPGDSEGPKFSFDKVADLLRGEKSLHDGEVRLLALIDQPLAGMQVDPASSQSVHGATLVVAHLQEPPLKNPQRDSNTRRDIITGREGHPQIDEPDPNNPLDPDDPI